MYDLKYVLKLIFYNIGKCYQPVKSGMNEKFRKNTCSYYYHGHFLDIQMHSQIPGTY